METCLRQTRKTKDFYQDCSKMPSCEVKDCGISQYKIKKSASSVTLHVFPSDKTCYKKWESFCGRRRETGKRYICSKHFTEADFDNVYCSNTRRVLRKTAVPSIRVSDPVQPVSNRAVRALRKARKEMIAELMETYEKKPNSSVSPVDVSLEPSKHNILHDADKNECADFDNEKTGNMDILFEAIHIHNITHEIPPQSAAATSIGNSTPLIFQSSKAEICDVHLFPVDVSFEPSIHSTFYDADNNECPDFSTERTGNMDMLFEAIRIRNNADEVPSESDATINIVNSAPVIFQNSKVEICDVQVSLGSENDSTHSCERNNCTQLTSLEVPNFEPKAKTSIRGTVTRLNGVIKNQRQTIRSLRAQLRSRDLQLKICNNGAKQQQRQLDNLQKDIVCLRKACEEMRSVPECVIKNRIRGAFAKLFTTNQIDLILNEKKKVQWTNAEIAMAFALRYHSQPAYQIVRSEMKIPLPCLRSLREWASRINMRSGILDEVFIIMKIIGARMTNREKVVVLAFDEMSVNATVERDKRNDAVVGPHKEMQVVSARGLFSNWKQPVFVDFDRQITTAILNEIITRFHDIGFTVVANVHDCGGGNMSLWKEVGIDFAKEQTTMQHPVTHEKIYFFPDVPHLLKLMRNWILDHGFYFKGQLVTKKFLEMLVEKASTLKKPLAKDDPEFKNVELNSMFKLSLRHVMATHAERQNVRLAAELLSHTTAVNLRRHFGEHREAVLLAEIIETIDKWFDVMNSYQLNQGAPSKTGYGSNLPMQNKILDAMESLMKNMRTLTKHGLPAATHLQTFQKAVLVSISSIKNLYLDMHAKFDISFILTHKVNQDFLENLFAILRLNGGTHDHPSPLEALTRIRLVILGKNLHRQLKRNQNTENMLIEEEFLVSNIFRKRKVDSANTKHIECIEELSDEEDFESWRGLSKDTLLEESDGTEYANGFIARSLLPKYPTLANPTQSVIDATEEGICKENYVQDLSYGRLLQPTDAWNNTANQLNNYFNYMHNISSPNPNAPEEIGFRNPKDVEKRTVRKFKSQFPDVPDKILHTYATKRINIRIKHMQKRLQEKKIHKYKVENKNAKKRQTELSKNEKDAIIRQNSRKLKHVMD